MEDVPGFLRGFDVSQHDDNNVVNRGDNGMKDQLILSFPIMKVPARWGRALDCAIKTY